MNLDPQILEVLKFGWGVLVTLASLAGAIVMLWASKNFVRRDEYAGAHTENQQKLASLGDRMTRVETELRQAPKHSDLVTIAQHVNDIGGRISRLEGQTQQTNHLLSAIHEHLLNSD